MTDIDFDELDRAVNSLVGGTSPQPEPTPQAPIASPPVEPISTAVPAQAPYVAPLAESAPQASVSVPASRPVQPRGRFLDVVHPQSAMVRGTNGMINTRVAPALTPLAPKPVQTPAPEHTATEPIVDTPPSAPVESTPAVVLDEPEFIPTSAASTFSADPTPEPDPLVPEGPSPFLSDAVVEKRPLGAFTGGETTSLASASEAALEIPEPTPKEVEVARPMPIVPPELSGNLVALESETVSPSSTQRAGGSFGAVGFTGSESAAQASGIEPVFSTGKNGKPLPKPRNAHGHKGWLWLIVGGVVVLLAVGVGVTFYLFVLK